MPAVTSLSGFPEWLPDEQLVENLVLDRVRARFELHGYAPLRTRSVEPVGTLQHQGETDKELYGLHRLGDERGRARLGLHFDLTVPLARYVAENLASLTFPFKRYQIQRAWRGERPQEGRYREFVQADVDVVARGHLPLVHDVELPGLLIEALGEFPIPRVSFLVNNRKLMDGFIQGLGIEDPQPVLRTLDKLGKIGKRKVAAALGESLPAAGVEKLLALAAIQAGDGSFVDEVRRLGVRSALLDEGLEELVAVVEGGSHLPPGSVQAALHVARGLDYYTGTVLEGFMDGVEDLGSVCSGGRYDNLVEHCDQKVREPYPGIGASIGVSRIFGYLYGRAGVTASRHSPTCVLVALNDEGHRTEANAIARRLRERGIPAEVFDQPKKYGKQIAYAQKKGIPYVWFATGEGEHEHEVRDLDAGEQVPAELDGWTPDAARLRVAIVRGAPGETG